MPLKIKHTSNCTMKFAYTKDYGLNIIVKYSGLYIFPLNGEFQFSF